MFTNLNGCKGTRLKTAAQHQQSLPCLSSSIKLSLSRLREMPIPFQGHSEPPPCSASMYCGRCSCYTLNQLVDTWSLHYAPHGDYRGMYSTKFVETTAH
jgi:hypothetical protein